MIEVWRMWSPKSVYWDEREHSWLISDRAEHCEKIRVSRVYLVYSHTQGGGTVTLLPTWLKTDVFAEWT